MKKVFERYETIFCILLVLLYIVINSYCIQNYGLTHYKSALINTAFSAFLIILIISLKRIKYYGLAKVRNPEKYFFFIPLILIPTVNLWNGININNPADEIVFYILTMINVGFIEEIIFRGFLFKMMEKDNLKIAISVNAITFGIGHIINLLNGAQLIPTLMQICYAISIGYLFVIIFHKSKSLIPCIITHSLINSLSIFNTESILSLYIAPIFLMAVPLIYAAYINKNIKEESDDAYNVVDDFYKVLYEEGKDFAQNLSYATPSAKLATKTEISFKERNVMIGTVRTSEQYIFNLENNCYYTPARFVDRENLPLKKVVIYETDKNGNQVIMRFGDVKSAKLVNRETIPVSSKRKNGNEKYWYFELDGWKELEKPIIVKDTYRGKPLYTNSFLLENCDYSYQLVSVNSSDEYALSKAVENFLKSSGSNISPQKITDKCMLCFEKGCFIIKNNR